MNLPIIWFFFCFLFGFFLIVESFCLYFVSYLFCIFLCFRSWTNDSLCSFLSREMAEVCLTSLTPSHPYTLLTHPSLFFFISPPSPNSLLFLFATSFLFLHLSGLLPSRDLFVYDLCGISNSSSKDSYSNKELEPLERRSRRDGLKNRDRHFTITNKRETVKNLEESI